MVVSLFLYLYFKSKLSPKASTTVLFSLIENPFKAHERSQFFDCLHVILSESLPIFFSARTFNS